MKRVLTILCLSFLFLLVQNTASAQANRTLVFRTHWDNYINPRPELNNWKDVYNDIDGRGLELAYGCRLDDRTWLTVPLKIGVARFKDTGKSEVFANLDLLYQKNLCKQTAFLVPNVHLGIGSTWNFNRGNFDFNMPAGVGLSLRLAPDIYLNAQTQFRFSIENRPGWQHGVGFVVNFGNPDRDGDGVSDKEDKCPDLAGLKILMGCPDRDADGIADGDDKCPDVAGLATLMGCPDRDADGIADGDDKCPDLSGPVATLGCPDRDNDGILDAEDDCPDVKGIVALRGCPDTDSDGITDANDKCPREAGPAATQGCPDRDGDGITDKDDKCPGDKGPASTFGCPDRDSDGVADKDDACPGKPGDSSHKGCPDTDGDGIFDDIDRCPDKAGVAALRGCPDIKKEDKAKLERAIKLVQFESGKAVLLKKSYAVLDEVVTVMNTYAEYSLNISGHTDNAGDDKMNLDLSQRRAKACYDYLVSKGIAAMRMASAGYGETKPVADNKTAAGREQNRRVEFELFVK